MIINYMLLIILVLTSLLTVLTRSLLRAALGLALTSALLSVIMFRMNAPMAGVFELSVCAGLISALFFSVISVTHPLRPYQVVKEMRARMVRFRYLPVILVVAWIVLSFVDIKFPIKMPSGGLTSDVRVMLWNFRQLDIAGQIILLLCGVFGVVILLKEMREKNG